MKQSNFIHKLTTLALIIGVIALTACVTATPVDTATTEEAATAATIEAEVLSTNGDDKEDELPTQIVIVEEANPITRAMLEQLAESKKVWETQNTEAGGSYTYASSFESWVGFGSETTIFVTNNVVTGRNYASYDADRQPDESYEEDAASIGTNSFGAPAKTIDQLYAECEEILKTKDLAANHINFQFFDDNLLNICEFSPKDCADDCAEGVRINWISFSQ